MRKAIVVHALCLLIPALVACGTGGTGPSGPADTAVDALQPTDQSTAEPAEADVADAEGPRDPGGDVPKATPETGDESTPNDPAGDNLPAPRQFGAACISNADCDSGYCVEGPDGWFCTKTCSDDCPVGWLCRSMMVGSDVVSLCVPMGARLCKECAKDSECGDGLCLDTPDGKVCGEDCSVAECPTGYRCNEVASGPDTLSKQCVPESGSCSCNVVTDGARRPCVRKNTIGTCLGFETCDRTTGWAGCTAPDAKAETCNDLDDNCDGQIDEDFKEKGKACATGVGECQRNGVQVCAPDGQGVTCNAMLVQGSPEKCDGLDNNCDGLVDEEWPELHRACTAGQGECLRIGAFNCAADGSGTECDAQGVEGVAELCNGKDDNCDGLTDEAFPDVGGFCTTGLGVCQRGGTKICSPDATTTVCSAPTATGTAESCDYLDNDCDGATDNGYVHNGKYDGDAACGNCFTDCTKIYDLPDAYGRCNATGAPRCEMRCIDGSFDLNGVPDDGCEFALDPDGIHVSRDDPAATDDAGCGLGPTGTVAGAHPCKSIGVGLARASATGRGKILVADGLYEETVTLVGGKSLLGGYRADTWERHLASTLSTVRGAAVGLHRKTIVADGVKTATLLEGFVIYGPAATQTGGNSYALWVQNSTSALAIRNNVVYAGSGGPGLNGLDGGNGTAGTAGTAGVAAKEIGADCFGECTTALESAGGTGGSKTCEGTSVSGGTGGRAVCPDWNESLDLCTAPCGSNPAKQTASAAAAGSVGANGGGTGGKGGQDAKIDGFCEGTCACQVPTGDQNGANGLDGTAGKPGAAGAGCTGGAGSLVDGEWTGNAATPGSDGLHGSGGGGGGGGGGVETYFDTDCSDAGHSDIGGSGGGGGSGGCRGHGGSAGNAGGGSFDLFLVWTATPTSAPAITGNRFARGFGGNGGQGGNGGTGGPGAAGASGGGSGAANLATFCAPAGGKGGQGGFGGHGGGGGGGCGGSAFAIYAGGAGSLSLGAYKTGNTFQGGGSGGQGGTGGGSMGTPGTAGTNGTVADANF